LIRVISLIVLLSKLCSKNKKSGPGYTENYLAVVVTLSAMIQCSGSNSTFFGLAGR